MMKYNENNDSSSDENVASIKSFNFNKKVKNIPMNDTSDNESEQSIKPLEYVPKSTKPSPFGNISFNSKAQEKSRQPIEIKKKLAPTSAFASFGKSSSVSHKLSESSLPSKNSSDSSELVEKVLSSTQNLVQEVLKSNKVSQDKTAELTKLLLKNATEEKSRHEEITTLFISAVKEMLSMQLDINDNMAKTLSSVVEKTSTTSVTEVVNMVSSKPITAIDEDTLESAFAVLDIIHDRFEANNKPLVVTAGDDEKTTLREALEKLLSDEKISE